MNRQWVESKLAQEKKFFEKLAKDQQPDYLYIGCSDSRVPANEIMGLEAGDVFVHCNIANIVANVDLNAMSVINYAVNQLQVKHIIVCGHYNCGGIKAAMMPKDLGILNPWLRNIRDVYRLHEDELDIIANEADKYNRLIELNVIEQCRNVLKLAVVQQQYAKTKYPMVHGWVFDLRNGVLIDLHFDFLSNLKKIQKIYKLTDID